MDPECLPVFTHTAFSETRGLSVCSFVCLVFKVNLLFIDDSMDSETFYHKLFMGSNPSFGSVYLFTLFHIPCMISDFST